MHPIDLALSRPYNIPRPVESSSETPKDSNQTYFSRIYTAYVRAIRALSEWLQNNVSFFVGVTFPTLMQEPFSVCRAVFDWIIYGCSGTIPNTNPQTLTATQLKTPPVLCIHGNFHHPTAFTQIAEALHTAYQPAIFTVHLPSGKITDKDTQIVREAINNIQALYQKHGIADVKIDLIGHSRGASIARHRFATSDSTRKVILLGSKPTANPPENCYHINGEADLFFTNSEIEQITQFAHDIPSHHHTFQTGHLGLLYSSAVHQQIATCLSSSYIRAIGPITPFLFLKNKIAQ